jgi:hypothetical protein
MINLSLWQAAKSTVASPDMLVELFERIESFFKRVKTHTEVVPSPELTDALAKIMAEVLLTLAVATKSMKKKWWSKSVFCDELLSLKFDQEYFLSSWWERTISGTPYRSLISWNKGSSSQ